MSRELITVMTSFGTIYSLLKESYLIQTLIFDPFPVFLSIFWFDLLELDSFSCWEPDIVFSLWPEVQSNTIKCCKHDRHRYTATPVPRARERTKTFPLEVEESIIYYLPDL